MDDIDTTKELNFEWAIVTDADVRTSGRQLVLSKEEGAKAITAEILYPKSGVEFESEECTPDADPAGQKLNQGFRRVFIKHKVNGTDKIVVRFDLN